MPRMLLPAVLLSVTAWPPSVVAFDAPDAVVLNGDTMGTSYRIVLHDEENSVREPSLKEQIDTRLGLIERRMSTWREDSEISKFNRSMSHDWFAVSADTANVVAEGLRIAEASDGAFDPTVAPLIRLWNFDAGRSDSVIPSDEQTAVALEHIGWQKLEVRLDPPALRKADPQLEINLSAIAKGYAVDEVSKLLTDADCTRHLVEIGGEMRASGRKPDGTPWRVGIEAPVAGQRQLYRNQPLPLEDRSIATSGDYRNFFEVDGQRYSHTIDPATGRPVTHTVTSVSVIAKTCMLADALATAINVLGIERGTVLAQAEGAEVFIIQREGDKLTEVATPDFPAFGDAPAVQPEAARKADNAPLGTWLAAAVIFGIAICGMAVGVIFSNRRLQGSCGGLNNMPGVEGSPCELCQSPADECRDPLARFRRKPADAAAGEASNDDA